MKKRLLLSVLLMLGLHVSADETPAEETSDTVVDAAAAPEPPVEHWATCEDSYLNYVRSLPAAQQKKETDNWWMLADRDYVSIKNDEFQYKEIKPKKEKEMTDLLAGKPGVQSILLQVKLGTYDFKKKGFPLTVGLNPGDKTLENQYDGSFSMGGIGGPPSASVSSCQVMGLDSKAAERMPGSVKFKPVNAAQLKFLKMDEADAKKVTANLKSSRIETVVVRLYPAKTALVTKKVGSMKWVSLVVSAEIREFEFSAGDDKLSVKF